MIRNCIFNKKIIQINLKRYYRKEDKSTFLDYICNLDINNKSQHSRLSGIVGTIGPSSRDPQTIMKMIEKGMNIVRLNLLHGSKDYNTEIVKNIRQAVSEYNKKIGRKKNIAIAVDTKGSGIRTGILEGGSSSEVELRRGDIIRVTINKKYSKKSNNKIVYVDWANIIYNVEIDNRFFIDNGLISLICIGKENDSLICKIENTAKLGSNKGVNLPRIHIDLPEVSDEDREYLTFALEQKIDIILASHIRTSNTINILRKILGEEGKDIKIIAKIDNPQGLNQIDDIITLSDGIMIARGNLGIELPTQKIFSIQKSIIKKCNKIGKPVICATQMLDSMMYNPRPTRAESSDVANAIIDGADCVLLAGETAKGLYPVECVFTMTKICKEAEAAIWQQKNLHELVRNVLPPIDAYHAIAIAAVESSVKCLATVIIVTTRSGRSAHLISRYRPKCPIITITRNDKTARQAHLFRALVPYLYCEPPIDDWSKDIDNQVKTAINFGKTRGYIKPGDNVILVTGWKRSFGFFNTMRILTIKNK